MQQLDTVLHMAVAYSDDKTLEAFIEKGEDVNTQDANGNTPLHLVQGFKTFECARILLQHGASVEIKNDWGNTPLHAATLRMRFDVINMLLDYGANVDAKNMLGDTPLHFAIKYACDNFNLRSWRARNIGIMQLFLDHGADPYSKAEYGKTSLDLCRYHEIREVLIFHMQNMTLTAHVCTALLQ